MNHTDPASYPRIQPGTDPAVIALLRDFRSRALAKPLDVSALRQSSAAILTYLASAAGRTDANCRTVGYAIMDDDDLWDALEALEDRDDALHDVIADMGEALHDTVLSPEVAENFDSTPERLLARLDRQ